MWKFSKIRKDFNGTKFFFSNIEIDQDYDTDILSETTEIENTEFIPYEQVVKPKGEIKLKYIKKAMKFAENCAKFLNIPYNEIIKMSPGELTMRLEVISELKAADNKRYKETGIAGQFSDVKAEEDRFVRDLENISGEKIPKNLKAENYKGPEIKKGMTQYERNLALARYYEEMEAARNNEENKTT